MNLHLYSFFYCYLFTIFKIHFIKTFLIYSFNLNLCEGYFLTYSLFFFYSARCADRILLEKSLSKEEINADLTYCQSKFMYTSLFSLFYM